MLNLSFVKTFVTLIDSGGFSDAALRLNLAQPTVSQQIQKLEAALGVVLIRRSHASCSPTEQGQAILPYARALLASADRLQAAAANDHLRIGCSGNIAAYFIAQDLKRFIETQSSPVRWDVRAGTNLEVADWLAGGEIDIATMEWSGQRAGLEIKPWRRESMVVIVAPEHPFAGRKSLTVSQLTRLELIGGERGSGTGTLLKRALGDRADQLRIVHSLHSTEAVKSAVAAGLGASIVLRAAVAREVEAGELRALSIRGVPLEKTFYVALTNTLPNEFLPMRLARFLAGMYQTN